MSTSPRNIKAMFFIKAKFDLTKSNYVTEAVALSSALWFCHVLCVGKGAFAAKHFRDMGGLAGLKGVGKEWEVMEGSRIICG